MTATRSLSATLQHLNRTFRADEAGAVPDAELVGRFVEARDEAAFTALVRRYGVLVFGVCQRVLRHEQDAEDAFQATFLVFARDAAAVQHAGAVGNWLYGVAHNVSRKARANRLRRAAKEQAAAETRPLETLPVVPSDLPELLDGELGALPERYRAPIVLCDLLGLTTQEAAAEVNCPPKTLGTRLLRARALLAGRLTRRGIALSVATLATAPGQTASAAVPPRLLDSTAQTAVAFTTGSAAVSPTVAALTTGVSTVMVYSSLKIAVLTSAIFLGAALSTVPVVRHLHAAHAPRAAQPATALASESATARTPITLNDVHEFLWGLIPWHAARAEDKKDDKKALSGVWTKKDGETKIEFAEKKVLKISPHGKDEVILVLCEYELGKDNLVEVKITDFEGEDGAKKKFGMVLPVGTKFSFKWKAEKGTATLDELKGDEIERFKSHFEGTFEEKK